MTQLLNTVSRRLPAEQQAPLDPDWMKLLGQYELDKSLQQLSISPDKGVSMKFDHTQPQATPAGPSPTATGGSLPQLPQPAAPVAPQQDVMSKLLGGFESMGHSLQQPKLLNALASLAASINPQGTWAHSAAANVQQRTANQLFNLLQEKRLQQFLSSMGGEGGEQSPFPQAPQQ